MRINTVKRSEEAVEYFRKNFNCSQAVFVVLGKENGLSEDECLKTACAFGGGMGRQQLTCGAVSGALMSLGMIHGKGLNDSDDKKQRTYELSQEFFRNFTQIINA